MPRQSTPAAVASSHRPRVFLLWFFVLEPGRRGSPETPRRPFVASFLFMPILNLVVLRCSRIGFPEFSSFSTARNRARKISFCRGGNISQTFLDPFSDSGKSLRDRFSLRKPSALLQAWRYPSPARLEPLFSFLPRHRQTELRLPLENSTKQHTTNDETGKSNPGKGMTQVGEEVTEKSRSVKKILALRVIWVFCWVSRKARTSQSKLTCSDHSRALQNRKSASNRQQLWYLKATSS